MYILIGKCVHPGLQAFQPMPFRETRMKKEKSEKEKKVKENRKRGNPKGNFKLEG
jgi:hypothetical protein